MFENFGFFLPSWGGKEGGREEGRKERGMMLQRHPTTFREKKFEKTQRHRRIKNVLTTKREEERNGEYDEERSNEATAALHCKKAKTFRKMLRNRKRRRKRRNGRNEDPKRNANKVSQGVKK